MWKHRNPRPVLGLFQVTLIRCDHKTTSWTLNQPDYGMVGRRHPWWSAPVTRAARCVLLLSSLLSVWSELCEYKNLNIKTVPNILYDRYSYVGQSVFSGQVSRLIFIYIYVSSTAPLSPLILLVRTVLLSIHTHTHTSHPSHTLQTGLSKKKQTF